jgi:site-specific DNA recombinase
LCGSPVSGTTLNGKYRYYKCRGSVPTATRGKICNAHYIQASELEEFVWQKFIKLLASPSTQIDALDEILGVEYDFDVISPIVAETESTELQAVEPQLESPKRSNLKLSIEEQIAKLKTKQKDCAKREQKCYEMLSSDDYDHDKTLDVINSWKQKQVEIEKEIIVLEETRKHTGVIKIIAPKISEISEKFKKNADSLGFIEKRQLLQVFRSHIVALPGDYKYTCLLNSYIGFGIPDSEFEYDEAKESQYAERIKDIEAKYPDLTVLDLTNKPNFEKSAYGQAIITFEKILVTIERTSASQHADSCPCRRV